MKRWDLGYGVLRQIKPDLVKPEALVTHREVRPGEAHA
jgi:hypothetical protein